MKPKMLFKILLDILMTILLLLLMARQLTGNSAHEWLGAGLFALWVPHHILNFGWYRHLRRGRFTPLRIAQTAVSYTHLSFHRIISQMAPRRKGAGKERAWSFTLLAQATVFT